MEIKIDYDPIGVVNLNLVKFEEDMKKNLDIKSSFMNNVIIKKCQKDGEDDLINYVYLNTDWGNVLMMMREARQDSADFVVYKCFIKGFVNYDPDKIDVESGIFLLKDKYVDEDIYFMTFNTNNPRIDKHLEYMLSQNIINYYKNEWKKVFKI